VAVSASRSRKQRSAIRVVPLPPVPQDFGVSVRRHARGADERFPLRPRKGPHHHLRGTASGSATAISRVVLSALPLARAPPPPEPAADWFEIPAGLLDGDPGLRPDKHIFVELNAPWHEIADSLPQFDKTRLRAWGATQPRTRGNKGAPPA
jgi:hypothetical protein